MKKLLLNHKETSLRTVASAVVLTLFLAVSLIPEPAAAAGSLYGVSAPNGLQTVARDDDEVTLAWNTVSGADRYEVYGYASSSENWIKIGETYNTHFEVEDLLSATVYKFKIRALSGNQVSDYSQVFSTSTSPREVNNLRASSKTKSSITLKWSQVNRAESYQVYRYNSTTGTWKRLITTSKTSYKVTGLSSGKYYKFKVRAVSKALGYSYYGDFEDIKVRTKSSTGTTSSGFIGKTKAKQIALERAGVSSSKADFVKVQLDYDDGVRIYDVEFYAGDYEYEFEINARTGAIYDYDRDYRWDD